MNADELIASYATEVASLLPRRQRRDVGIELHQLLTEELQARADAAQRPADATMALELLHDFGRPAEVATRYRAPLVIIDPLEGRRFLRLALVGMALIWLGGALSLSGELKAGGGVLAALGHWWTGAGLAALWWPGFLVVCFGLATWARRRWPQSTAWRPRVLDPDRVNRLAMVSALAAIACGLAILVRPTRLLDLLFDGRAAPAAYAALSWTDGFLHGPAPWLLLGLLLSTLPMIHAVIRGRWSPAARRVEIVLGLAICALMLWTAFGGPVLQADVSDRFLKAMLLLLSAVSLLDTGLKLRRRSRAARLTAGMPDMSAR